MNTTPPNRPLPQATDLESKMRAWLELRREVELLHARMQYLKLIIKLGVGSH